MRLSYIIISFNRRDTLLRTLNLLPFRTPLARHDWDIWVVDNASTDGSADAVAFEFPQVNLIRNRRNEGMAARNRAFAQATGELFISLDDDSYPQDHESVLDMLSFMDSHPETGALVGKVLLPDGNAEAPALPSVLMGGASCLRRTAIQEVGGFPREFFRQAEEYDLSFRLWNAGWRVERCERSVVFRHEKVAGSGRASSLVHRMDLRNNLIVAERFLPDNMREHYRQDWAQRYSAIARHAGQRLAAIRGRVSGAMWGLREEVCGRRTLNLDAIENIFGFDAQAAAVNAFRARYHAHRVAIADFSKNVFATHRACALAGLEITALADDNAAFKGLSYRGVPILPYAEALRDIDGVVLSNINPAQIDARLAAIAKVFDGPVLRLWTPSPVVLHKQMRAA